MAKDSSFDVVSTVDMQEVDNAVQQTARELSQRYDLKGSGSSIELSKAEGTVTVYAPAEFVANQVIDILNGRLVKRSVDLKSVSWDKPVAASGDTVRVIGRVVQGIDKECAKKISKDIRDLKLKVKAQIDDDKLRVTSASKDALQQVISHLKSQDYGIPLQFTNYR
ncbi:YajQ family cyclic di-GMP-binding protein [uncultured Parolsenella sp.]|uniref:YajQ family cyclic di-GMP-binding protein n=1 Tax=uncultured Parolsenella sp. TaxID=2083008 RepID=UPI0025F75029|nr:YajQ family cyclic di-GMP-binding protein [uncultured Parolsenella sp.]